MTLMKTQSPILRNLFDNKIWFPTASSLLNDFYGEMSTEFIPAVNISETESNFHLDFKVPGYEKENFKITLENDLLNISAEIKKEENVQEKNYSRREFYLQSFKRSFKMPENIDVDKMEAKYENGILFVNIPKIKKEPVANTKEIRIS